MKQDIGHNGDGQLNIDVDYLASVVGRLLVLQQRHDTLSEEQVSAIRSVGNLLWRDGWRGRDGRRLPSPMDRFLSKVSMTSETACWEWMGSTTPNGYGLFSFDGGYKLAHRWSVGVTRGLEGGSLVVDHLCRNKRCVNPAHLEEVSQSINVHRGDGPGMAAARLSAITHCRHGHPLLGANVYLNPKGYRSCRKCGTKRKLSWQRLNRSKK